MKFAKSAVASLVALGLVAAPLAAQAAPVRASSQIAESEEFAGGEPFILYLALAAAALALYFFVIDDDDADTDGLPASP